VTPAQLGALIAALVLGGILGAVGLRLTDDSGPLRATETIERGGGTLETLPEAPVAVEAESIRYPAGFESTRTHGGPTFMIVQAGEVEIVEGGLARAYEAGEFFFREAARPYTMRILEAATLSVIRLLPPGAEATTELED